jgi:putative ABC transport system permease protein
VRARAGAKLALSILGGEPNRLALSLAGIAFAVLLILVQLGFKGAVLDACTAPIRALDADVVIQDRERQNLLSDRKIRRRLLAAARGVPGVAAASPLYMDYIPWRSRADGAIRSLRVYGIDPHGVGFRGEIGAQAARLARRDAVLYDRRSMAYHGPAVLGPGELGRRRIDVVGLVSLGTSVFYDGTVVTSDETFSRLRFVEDAGPGGRSLEQIDLGLVRVAPGCDPAAVARALGAALAGEKVLVLTRDDMVARERAYIETHVPLASMIGLGVLLGLFVGVVICYQILYTDIMDHAPQFATLKAIGYRRVDLLLVVALEATVLAVGGYVPSFLVSLAVYPLLESATGYPFHLGADRVAATLALALGMCIVSAFIAVRRLAALDPADVFR